MLATRDIALYAAIVGTLAGAWSIYLGVFLDRARIRISVAEGETISPGANARTPVVMVRVSNRGRRAAHITHISRVVSARRNRHELSADIMRQLAVPIRLDESEGKTVVHGAQGGYTPGSMPLKRWYVVDGAGRIHPLRERYRQRVERILWPTRRPQKPSSNAA